MCRYIRDPLMVMNPRIDTDQHSNVSRKWTFFKISVPNGIAVGTFDNLICTQIKLDIIYHCVIIQFTFLGP